MCPAIGYTGDFNFFESIKEVNDMQSRELTRRLKSDRPPTIIDVRSGMEFRSGHIPGALHAPSWRIILRMAGIPADKSTELVVTCEHGPRAMLAKGLLGVIGYRNVTLLDGHMASWRQSELPLEK